MQPNQTLRDALIDHLQQAYALEDQLTAVLEQHALAASPYPNIQQQLQLHLAETRQHRARMEMCLANYDQRPNGMVAALGLSGRASTMRDGQAAPTLIQNAQDDYLAENLEIALYTSLIAIAVASGDHATARECKLNLQEDIIAAKWLVEHLSEIALLSLNATANNPVTAQQIAQAQAESQAALHEMWDYAKQPVTSQNADTLAQQQPSASAPRLNPGYNQSAIPPSAIPASPTDAGAQPATTSVRSMGGPNSHPTVGPEVTFEPTEDGANSDNPPA